MIERSQLSIIADLKSPLLVFAITVVRAVRAVFVTEIAETIGRNEKILMLELNN